MDSEQRSILSKAVIEKWNAINKNKDKCLAIQPDLSDILYVEELIGILAERHEYSYAKFPSKNDFTSVYDAVQSLDVNC